MPVEIKKIEIENFRSIRTLSISANSFTVLVGKNDSGKSNILRALNLFFNSQTNPNQALNFEEDYCFFAPIRTKKAKEIVVRIELELPQSYHQTNGQIVEWEKRWRSGGLHHNKYNGVRIKEGPRGKFIREKVVIPDKSNVHELLRRIEFEYVPAIRDAQYFGDLRGRIYKTISEVAAEKFRTSSTEFEEAIGEHLRDLTDDIGTTLGLDTSMVLPHDLSHIFERLDFVSGTKRTSLEARGDGVKVRHVPLILKFMSEKKKSLRKRGAMPFTYIWGYEEPENNLEFTNAVTLADRMLEYSMDDEIQVFLTTHSPAFYDSAAKNTKRSAGYLISNEDEKLGTVAVEGLTQADKELGITVLMASKLSEVIDQVRAEEQANAEVQGISKNGRPVLFVEGESDKIVIEKAIQLFHPEDTDKIEVRTKVSGAGYRYVIDMLSAWRAHHKHHPEGSKAAGLLDSDASESRAHWNKQEGNVDSAKCFEYPKTPLLIEIVKAGFRVPTTLETLYEPAVWERAQLKGDLQKREKVKVFPRDKIDSIIEGKTKAASLVKPNWELLVNYDFDPESKVKTARYVSKLEDQCARALLCNFEKILEDVLEYLEV